MRLSLVWIVPIVALVVGVVLIARALLQAGPEITINFRSAEGIEPGRTEVRFKEVVVGRVKSVAIGPKREKVLVTAALDRSVKAIAVEDSRFWVVRPRVGHRRRQRPGHAAVGRLHRRRCRRVGSERSDFVGLEAPPLVLRGEPGRSFVLSGRRPGFARRRLAGVPPARAGRPGRRLCAGRQRARAGHSGVHRSPVRKPGDAGTRFWNASGIDLSLNASGLTLNTQSLASVLAGGVAFAAPPDAEPGPAAASGQRFKLFSQQHQRSRPDDGEPMRVRMVFEQSQRGLVEGAPVDLLGVEVGIVRSVSLLADPTTRTLPGGGARRHLSARGWARCASAFSRAEPGATDRMLLNRLVDAACARRCAPAA